MPAKKLIALVMIFGGIVALIGFAVLRYTRSRQPTAGLKVETVPASLVFVDNVELGTTPVDKFFQPGEVTVKLVPTSSSSSLSTYQTKVKLTDNAYTIIRRDFGSSDANSAGEIVSLQTQSGSGAGLSVVTSGPDAASVVLDGQPQGFTPLSLNTVSAGPHQIVVSAPGYLPRTITAQAVLGYKLTLNVKLAATDLTPTPMPTSAPATVSGTPKVTPKVTPKSSPVPTSNLPRPYVTIGSTPTGFLRVRQKPSTGSTEVGRVKPGESYSLLSTSSDWFQIKIALESTSSGWISSEYATKFE